MTDKPRQAGEQVPSTRWQLRAQEIVKQLPSGARAFLGAAGRAASFMRFEDWEALAKFCAAMVDNHLAILGAPMPCATCGGIESTCNCECGGNYCGCPCHLAQEAWALGREGPK